MFWIADEEGTKKETRKILRHILKQQLGLGCSNGQIKHRHRGVD